LNRDPTAALHETPRATHRRALPAAALAELRAPPAAPFLKPRRSRAAALHGPRRSTGRTAALHPRFGSSRSVPLLPVSVTNVAEGGTFVAVFAARCAVAVTNVARGGKFVTVVSARRSRSTALGRSPRT
jgi:hypothetical protein